MLNRVLAVGSLVLLSRALGAQVLAPTIGVAPAEPVPGSIVRFTLTDASARTDGVEGGWAGDAIVAIRGRMAGEPMQFLADGSGRYRAIGAVPVDASDSVVASVIVERASGAADSLRVAVAVPHVTRPRAAPRLNVDQRFTQPLDAATQARIARENARARRIGQESHNAPPMWTAEFVKPRDAVVTSEFGTGRMFNGTVASRHLGVDFRGVVGAPVHAANRGVVALVDTFFLAGRVVYVDHGGGVVTGYFHLTSPLVAKGDTVERGQQIGTVGATGRVTGPHLHWTARYGTLTFNPLDLIALEPVAYSGAMSGGAP